MKRTVVDTVLASSILVALVLFRQFHKGDSLADPKRFGGTPGIHQEALGPMSARQGNEPQLRDAGGHGANRSLTVAIDAEEDPDNQGEALERVARGVPDSKLRATLDDLIAKDNGRAIGLRQLLVHRWAEADPRAAGQWASQLSDGSAYREAIEQVAIAWAGVDPQGAAGWVGSWPENAAKGEALMNVGY